MSERTNERTNIQMIEQMGGEKLTCTYNEVLLVQAEVQLVKFAHSVGRLLFILQLLSVINNGLFTTF